MRKRIMAAMSWIAQIGVQPDDSRDLRVKRAIISYSIVISIIVLAGVLGPLSLLTGQADSAMVLYPFVLLIIVNFVVYARVHHNMGILIGVIAVPSLLLHFADTYLSGGFVESGGTALWGLFFPVVAVLVVMGPRQALVWFIVWLINIVLCIWLVPRIAPPPIVTADEYQVFLMINLIIISSLIFGILAYFVSQRELAYRLLEGEQARSEGLLLNILPPEIAAILKLEPRTIAEQYEGASILFADVVNFTPLSAGMSPTELVEMLNEVFTTFDALTEKYGLEKIKTIGDCYMVASGVPRPRSDHALALTHLAVEMRECIAQREFRGRRLDFRIGLNSGPVVAGVIGRKKFIYDLWGDAVNTASRMESHGAGGIIQITGATYELIKDEFICKPRGMVQVKGKGEMEVWQVIGAK
jgi:adenylate cyclase